MTAPILVPREVLDFLVEAGDRLHNLVDLDAEDLALVENARSLLAGAGPDSPLIDAEPDGDAVILSMTLAVPRDTDLERTEAGRLTMARDAAERAGLDPGIVQQHPAGGLYVRLPRP